MGWRAGLWGTDFASLAKKNCEPVAVDDVEFLEYPPTSGEAVLKETVGRLGKSLSMPEIPNPGPWDGVS